MVVVNVLLSPFMVGLAGFYLLFGLPGPLLVRLLLVGGLIAACGWWRREGQVDRSGSHGRAAGRVPDVSDDDALDGEFDGEFEVDGGDIGDGWDDAGDGWTAAPAEAVEGGWGTGR